MTPREYNRDVKRLRDYIKNLEDTPYPYLDYPEKVAHIEGEFKRLYNADDTFKYASKDSILGLMAINQRFRIIPLHSFELFVNI